MQPTIIGLDLAKSVFRIHDVDEHGKVALTKRLRCDGVLRFFANLPACVVGMEACASAPFWDHSTIARRARTVTLPPVPRSSSGPSTCWWTARGSSCAGRANG